MAITTKTFYLIIFLQLLDQTLGQDEIKRSPQGFMGMRGKKYEDRRMKTLLGYRGQKHLYNLIPILDSDPYGYYKRAPMGFMGMRGKKSAYDDSPETGSLYGQIDYISNENIDPSDYGYLNNVLNKYLQEHQNPNNLEAPNEITDSKNEEIFSVDKSKRAAESGKFFGMRGKKETYSGKKEPFGLAFRGKFVGVRGKKDLLNSGGSGLLFQDDSAGLKRAPANAFFGMRGKKSYGFEELTLKDRAE